MIIITSVQLALNGPAPNQLLLSFLNHAVAAEVVFSRDEDPTFFSTEPDPEYCPAESGPGPWKKMSDPHTGQV